PRSANANSSSRDFSIVSVLRASILSALIIALLFTLAAGSSAQGSKKKKSKKRSVPCRTGCKPETSTPDISTSTADAAAALQHLSEMARALHNGTPGAYDKLAAFVGKHSNDIWGARAALALGYDDNQKNRTAPASVWLTKAKSDTVLEEYVLYWRAQ